MCFNYCSLRCCKNWAFARRFGFDAGDLHKWVCPLKKNKRGHQSIFWSVKRDTRGCHILSTEKVPADLLTMLSLLSMHPWEYFITLCPQQGHWGWPLSHIISVFPNFASRKTFLGAFCHTLKGHFGQTHNLRVLQWKLWKTLENKKIFLAVFEWLNLTYNQQAQ